MKLKIKKKLVVKALAFLSIFDQKFIFFEFAFSYGYSIDFMLLKTIRTVSPALLVD